jgi:hypothetical protein
MMIYLYSFILPGQKLIYSGRLILAGQMQTIRSSKATMIIFLAATLFVLVYDILWDTNADLLRTGAATSH